MFSRKSGVKFEVRASSECHDRAIFIDKEGFVLGSSIKDTAKNKPAYLIRLNNPSRLEKGYQKIWNFSKSLI
jgi:hypothetical protein